VFININPELSFGRYPLVRNNMPESISFGTWLRQKRRSLDLTQKAFADRVGCAEITVRRMEADEYKPSNELALVLFENLGIPESERPQWVRFARGLEEHPNRHSISSPTHKQITNLPLLLTTFIGRKNEQTAITNLLAKNRLVTLTGVGGIGKTRLSIQVASALSRDFPDGIWLVEFAPLSDSALIAQVVVNTLDLIDQANRHPRKILTDFLQTKKTLLVFDNCEHLIPACAELTEALLYICPDLKILTTSREVLGIDGETVYLVPSLTTPDALRTTLDDLSDYEAVQLFLERAQSAMSGFSMTQDNASALAQICHRLDGIPLALELAAARVKLLRVEEIAARLDDRFGLLTSGSRTALPRHQTLQAMVDWSHDLLSETERVLLRRLSIFSGGWTLEAAENVCTDEVEIHFADILDLLTSLFNKSLIIVERKVGDKTRYSMLETIRQYAHEKLLRTEGGGLMRQRHLTYFVNLAERGNVQIHGPDQIEWMDRLENEVDNFRAALDWSVSERHTELALRLLGALSWTWDWRGYFREIRSWFDQVRTFPDVADYPVPYARLLNYLGNERRFAGDRHYVQLVLKESQEIWLKLGTEGEQGLAQALDILGEIVLYDDKDIKAAHSLFERSFNLYHKCGDEWGMAWLTYHFGVLAYAQNRYAEAEHHFMKSLAKFQELGDKSGAALVLSGLGEMARVTDDYERASKYWEQNLELFRELQARFPLAWPYIGLGWVSLHTGDFKRASTLFEEGLILSNESGNDMNIALSLTGLAGVLAKTGKPERAAQLLGVADSILEGLVQMEPADQKDFDYYLSIVRGQLDESAFAFAWDEGRVMTLEQAIEYALEGTHE
jgi:predicted ATPase/DNA-binding XRE family transcriptional regulator